MAEYDEPYHEPCGGGGVTALAAQLRGGAGQQTRRPPPGAIPMPLTRWSVFGNDQAYDDPDDALAPPAPYRPSQQQLQEEQGQEARGEGAVRTVDIASSDYLVPGVPLAQQMAAESATDSSRSTGAAGQEYDEPYHEPGHTGAVRTVDIASSDYLVPGVPLARQMAAESATDSSRPAQEYDEPYAEPADSTTAATATTGAADYDKPTDTLRKPLQPHQQRHHQASSQDTAYADVDSITDVPSLTVQKYGRAESEKRLAHAEAGTWLVRPSSSTGDFAVSVKTSSEVVHLQLNRLHHGRNAGHFVLGQFSIAFPSLAHTIQHFSSHPLQLACDPALALRRECI